MHELQIRFTPGCSCREAIRCLRAAMSACLCAAFLMFTPCVAYAAKGDFASELPIVAESMSAREGASAASGPQDADNDVTFEKSGLVLENDVLTSYGTDGALKPLAGWQLFEGSWYWFDNSAIASAGRWAAGTTCLMMGAWQQIRFQRLMALCGMRELRTHWPWNQAGPGMTHGIWLMALVA